MGLKIKRFDTASNAQKNATDRINKLLKENKNHSVLLLLSGGSALSLLDDIDTMVISERTTITVLDERYIKDPKINNFAQVAALKFCKDSKKRGAKFIDTRLKDHETHTQLATRYESALNMWIKENPKEKIIATIGIGEDTHIAGIMPTIDQKEFKNMFENKNLATAYDAGTKNQYPLRVTTTITFLQKIDSAVVYAVGENKREALKSVLYNDQDIHDYPARIINRMKDVSLFTDVMAE